MARKSKDSGTVTAIMAVIVIGLITSAIDFVKENWEAFAVIGVIIAGIIAMRIAKQQRARLKAEYARQEALERKANAVKKPSVSAPTYAPSYTPSYTSEPEPVKEEAEQSAEIKMPTITISFSNSSNYKYHSRELKGESIIKSLNDYVAIDFETTGLDPNEDEIIEFAAVRVEGGNVVDTFTSLCNPRRQISEKITKITGITNEMLADAPDVASVLKEFLSFVGDSVVVGHNVSFDVNFVYDSCLRHEMDPFKNDHIDTCRISRKCTEGAKNHKLETLVKHYGIVNDNAHRALSDALSTQKLYEIMKGCIVGNDVLPLSPIFGAYTPEAIYNTFLRMIEPEENTVELKINTKNAVIKFFGKNTFYIRINSRSTNIYTEENAARDFVLRIPGAFVQNETQYCFPLETSAKYTDIMREMLSAVYESKRKPV